MRISGIYKIQSRHKFKRCYIGSAVNIGNRWNLHLNQLKNNKHASIKLQRHYNKYGKNDLVFSIILCCDKEDLIITEQFFIDAYNPYFNTCKIAGSQLGNKWSNEAKIRQSKNNGMRGKIPWNKGKHPSSKETRDKIGLAGLGRIPYNKGKKMSDKQKINSGRKKGSIPWNKGKKGLQVAWNKGLKLKIV